MKGETMPIRIPDALPATDILESENIFVMTEFRAIHQDIRPLKLALLNLMPTKIATETQIMRKLSNTPLQIEVAFLQTASHRAKNVPEEHLAAFYRTFDEVKAQHFDGMIITGAPVETLDFEHVDYWSELCSIMEWSRTNVHSTLHICWGAQAAIYYHYGIPKHDLGFKMFGVFPHRLVKKTSPWVRGFDDEFATPHSRYTEVREDDIAAHPALEVIARSDEAGVLLAKSTDSRHFFVFGHPEYDAGTLKAEYERDRAQGRGTPLPRHYFPHDDPAAEPRATWRAHAQLLYTNWLNYYVYQTTPYDIAHAGDAPGSEDAGKSSEQNGSERSDEGSRRSDESSTKADGRDGSHERKTLPTGARNRKRAGTVRYEPARAVRAHGNGAGEPEQATPARKTASVAPYLRAETEDDDGYDPYSDRHDEPPLFERDPWD